MSKPKLTSCPKCGGTSGYKGSMTETHKMFGEWGEGPEATDSGFNVSFSLMKCLDCGKQFRVNTCQAVEEKASHE